MHSFEVHSNESACRKSGRLGLEQVRRHLSCLTQAFYKRLINFFCLKKLDMLIWLIILSLVDLFQMKKLVIWKLWSLHHHFWSNRFLVMFFKHLPCWKFRHIYQNSIWKGLWFHRTSKEKKNSPRGLKLVYANKFIRNMGLGDPTTCVYKFTFDK